MKYWRAGGRLIPIPQCEWCRSYLMDSNDNPRWEIFDGVTFVCYEGCLRPMVRQRSWKAPARKRATGRGKRVAA